MSNENSCTGCKFLCKQDFGYSNWTVTDVKVFCAKEQNPNLPADEPYNWFNVTGTDMWPKTNNSRCASFSQGEGAYFDVDGEVKLADYADDKQLYQALMEYGYRE